MKKPHDPPTTEEIMKAFTPPDAPTSPEPEPENIVTPMASYTGSDPIQLASINLNEAAEFLLRALPPFVAGAIRFHAEAQRLPLWQLVCGVLNMAHSSSMLSMPILDPAWGSANPILEAYAQCKQCGKTFRPKRRGQPYCSNECGLVTIDEEFQKRLKAAEAQQKAEMRALMEDA